MVLYNIHNDKNMVPKVIDVTERYARETQYN